jgi:hypothetical protein
MPAGSGTLGPATSFKNNTRLSAVVALFSADPAKAEFAKSFLRHCGTATLRVDLNDGHNHGRRISNPIS